MRLPLQITYTDDSVFEGDALDWDHARSDGVDAVLLGGRKFSGHSLYWLYREATAWVVGGASTYESPPPPETLFYETGDVVQRKIMTMPDLKHAQVKLGWWKRERT